LESSGVERRSNAPAGECHRLINAATAATRVRYAMSRALVETIVPSTFNRAVDEFKRGVDRGIADAGHGLVRFLVTLPSMLGATEPTVKVAVPCPQCSGPEYRYVLHPGPAEPTRRCDREFSTPKSARPRSWMDREAIPAKNPSKKLRVNHRIRHHPPNSPPDISAGHRPIGKE
jgi:hypothetical protein